jgi:hypothetical protein
MFEDVFKHMPPHLARQREQLRALRALEPRKGSEAADNLEHQTRAVAKEG